MPDTVLTRWRKGSSPGSRAGVAVILAAALVFLGAAPAIHGQIMGLYYQEEFKEGRFYVFNSPEAYNAWKSSGEMAVSLTLTGRGPNGETVIAENETAMDLFLFRYNLPAFERDIPAPPKPPAPPPAPNVALYGRAHVTTDYLDNGNDGGLNLSSNSSRLGFRANTQIAKNLRGVMQIEQEVRWENSAGNFASRDTFVGLQGDFGMVRLGFFDTPLKIVRGRTDFFGDQIGDARNLTRLRDNYGGAYDFDTRFRNGIHYRSPNLSGVVFDLHYSTNTDSGTNPPSTSNDAFSGSLTYTNKALYLAGAYERKEDTGADAFRLGFGYNVGDFRIAGLAQTATIKAPGVAGQDVSTYGLGASYEVSSATTLKGQYYWVDADGADRNATMVALGLDYSLNRAFRLLFAYARTTNDDAARYTMSAGGHGAQVYPAAPGLTSSGFSVGFRYDF